MALAHEDMSDVALVEATRAGDQHAFGYLWKRHYTAAIAAARATTTTFDPDDIAQEAFASIYTAIKRGGGPTSGFRAYLLTSVRNVAAGWGRSRREVADDQMDDVAADIDLAADAEAELNRSITATAFRSLPTRWQEVLWYTEVERMKPAAVAPLLGMKPVAVAQLAFRARDGLREAWIQAHLHTLSDDSECHWVVERLGAYARHNSSKRDTERIDLHLQDCAKCMIIVDEASLVSDQLGSARLGMILLPLMLGATASVGYLAWVRGGELLTGIGSAVPEMPAKVTPSSSKPGSLVGAAKILAAAAAAVALAGVSVTAVRALSENNAPSAASVASPSAATKPDLQAQTPHTALPSPSAIPAIQAPATPNTPVQSPVVARPIAPSTRRAQPTPPAVVVPAAPAPVAAPRVPAPVEPAAAPAAPAAAPAAAKISNVAYGRNGATATFIVAVHGQPGSTVQLAVTNASGTGAQVAARTVVLGSDGNATSTLTTDFAQLAPQVIISAQYVVNGAAPGTVDRITLTVPGA